MMLVCILLEDQKDSLFVQHVGNPENTPPLLDLGSVETEVGTLLVETDTVCQSHGGSHEEVGRLWIWGSEEEETLNTLDENVFKVRYYIPLPAKPEHSKDRCCAW